MNPTPSLDRRSFLEVSLTAVGGLLLTHVSTASGGVRIESAAEAVPLGVFIRIEPDDRVFIGARCPDIGQGVKTSLPMIIADELDVVWSQVTVEQLPLGLIPGPQPSGVAGKYGPQGAGGSTSVPDGWSDLRLAGAQARRLLVRAAAQRWRVDPARLSTTKGRVVHPDGRTLRYGELAATAAGLAPEKDPPALKQPANYSIIGTPTRVVDAREIVTGRAHYGIDTYGAGALTAVIARCPYFDGGIERYDASKARLIPGVRQVLEIAGPALGAPLTANLATGIAVLADDTWSAMKGREALEIVWTRGPHAGEDSAGLDQQCEGLLAGSGRRVRNDGDVDTALTAAAKRVTATYRIPFVSHAPIEPQNAFADVRPDRVTIIAPMQQPGGASRVASAITGVPRLQIEVQMTRVGGGFGRRLTNDFVAEAVLLSKLSGKPVKLVWTREDDLAHDWYRPFGHHQLSASLDREDRVTGWTHRLASTSKYYRRADVKPEDHWTSEIYPDDFPAQLVPNLRLEWLAVESGMTRGSWRAPAHTANAFVVQSFVDELAHASGQDPVEPCRRLGVPGRQHASRGRMMGHDHHPDDRRRNQEYAIPPLFSPLVHRSLPGEHWHDSHTAALRGQQPNHDRGVLVNRKAETVPNRKAPRQPQQRDVRVRRTAMALSQALVSLVLEKRYDAITVQDLLDRAEVGRSTFYSHYRGKDDLLLRSFERMLDMFDQRLPPGGTRTAPVRQLFEHVDQFRHFYQAMRRARILDRQWQVAIERLSASIERRLGEGSQSGGLPPTVVAQALAGALCALLRWWIETDTPYSAEQMDAMYHRIRVS